MKNYVIVADVTCDLPKEICERFGVEVLPGHIVFPDGSEHVSVPDFSEVSREEFFAALKKEPNGFKTSPPNIDEFAAAFEKYVESGSDVLCLTISGGMSGTYNFSLKARDAVLEKHPEAKIVCVDSLRYSTLLGLLTIYAAKLRDEGKSIDECAAWLEENKKRFHQMGWLDDLSFVARKGRISNSAAFFGTLIGIKPLGDIDKTGLTTVLGKAKGEKSAYAAILSYMEKTIEAPEEQIVFVAQSNREKQAAELARRIEERFHPKEIVLSEVFPACAVNVGPGLMAAYYVGKPLSEGLAEERALMTDILSK